MFILIALLMLAAALAFLLWPLLAGRGGASVSRRESNLAVLRDERASIESDVAAGLLPASARDEALAELAQRAGEDLATPEPAAPSDNRPLILAVVLAAGVPITVLLAYLSFGTPAAITATPADPARKAERKIDDQQILAMVESLKAKMKERPDDVQGWQLLARSMAAMQRFPEAAEAYQNLARLRPDDPNVLADYADALAVVQDRTLTGQPIELVRKALAIDPTHKKALALAGTEALNSNRFAEARDYWQRLYDALPADSTDRPQVKEVLEEIRQRATAAGVALPAQAASPPPAAPLVKPAPPAAAAAQPPAAAAAAAPASASANRTAIAGSVAIAPALAAKAVKGDTLFIVARASGANAPRAPLAVFRAQVGDWPLTFRLDESMAMAPGNSLATASEVDVEARVAKGGGATRQPGDLVGAARGVKPGTTGVTIVIDSALP